MAVYLHALTSSGGVPLYSRTIGDAKPLPYPVVGSLNGVHMYGRSGDVELLGADSEQSNICWKSFHDSITLILVADKSLYTKEQVADLLDMIYDTMTLLLGLDELITVKNVERFKRDVRVCFSLIDYILKIHSTSLYSDITGCIDTLNNKSMDVLQNSLFAFTDSASSLHGSLMISGRVIMSTPEWSSLSNTEQILLCYLVNSLPAVCAGRDIPVYLPYTSPRVAQRLVTFTLISGTEVCLLCGPTPTFSQLEKEVERFWQPSLDSLRQAYKQLERNLPSDIKLDPNILGLVFTNFNNKKCISSYPADDNGYNKSVSLSPSNTESKRKALREFMLMVKSSYPTFSLSEISTAKSSETPDVMEVYTCLQTFKLYAVKQSPYRLYVLYNTKVPTYALGSVTKKLLSSLVKEKLI